MKKYVVGILIDKSYERVLLIRKRRPWWQDGRLNGVGGHIEEGESAYEAMCRECKEECNLEIYNWLELGTISDEENFKVYYFCSTVDNFSNVKTLTDEIVELIPLEYLNYRNIVPPTDVFIRLSMSPTYLPVNLIKR